MIIGTVTGTPLAPPPIKITTDVPDLEPFCSVPLLSAELSARYGFSLPPPTGDIVPATVPEELTHRHCLFVAPTGGGKTTTMRFMAAEVLASDQQPAAVAFDPKLSTLLALAAEARALGIPPEQVFFFAPSIDGACFRLPLFGQGLPINQAASLLVDLLEGAYPGNTPRRHDVLLNAASLVGLTLGERASIYEMFEVLRGEEGYRGRLLERMQSEQEPFAAQQLKAFFRREFDRWSKAERAQAVAPCTRLLRELVRSQNFFGLLCSSPRSSVPALRLADLWQQGGPRLVLVHLDATLLGEQGGTFLAGIIARFLFAAAMRQQSAARPVYLIMDELPRLAPLLGEQLETIVSVARSQRLHLICACQHLSQLPPSLAETLAKQCAVQFYFRTDFDEARRLAAALVAGAEPPISNIKIAPPALDKTTGTLPTIVLRLPILDGAGVRQRVKPVVWQTLPASWQKNGLPLTALSATAAGQRLYVLDPATERPVELSAFAKQIAPCTWRIVGPDLTLRVTLPRVIATRISRLSESEQIGRVAHTIETLPNRTAVLRLDNRLVGVVWIRTVPDAPCTPDDQAYVRAALAANGQTAAAILAALTEREQLVEAAVGTTVYPPDRATEGDDDDGSRW